MSSIREGQRESHSGRGSLIPNRRRLSSWVSLGSSNAARIAVFSALSPAPALIGHQRNENENENEDEDEDDCVGEASPLCFGAEEAKRDASPTGHKRGVGENVERSEDPACIDGPQKLEDEEDDDGEED